MPESSQGVGEGGGPRFELRQHVPLISVLAAGTLLRVACTVAYWPTLFASDSRAYLGLGLFSAPVGFQPDRSSGYPLLLRALLLPTHQLATVSLAQHLAGLVVGVLVYRVLLERGTRRWLATTAAAVVLLDSYEISLEQYVMSETLFACLLILSAYALLRRRPKLPSLISSGVLLGIAATFRPTGLFAIPAYLVYLLWTRRRAWVLATWSAALLTVLAGYAALQLSTSGGGSPFHSATGWYLYGRVAGFADCKDTDVPTASLCPRGGERGRSPAFYLWASSPATRAFPGGPDRFDQHANRLLLDFASGVIRDQPLDYLGAVVKDMLRLAANARGQDQQPDPLLLPERIELGQGDPTLSALHRRFFRGSPWPVARFPARELRGYQTVMHTQGWLIALLLLVSFAALLQPLRRAASPRSAETMLLSGGGALIALAAIATAGGLLRYVVPEVPLIAAGGALAIEDLLNLRAAGLDERRPALRSRSTVLGGDVAAP